MKNKTKEKKARKARSATILWGREGASKQTYTFSTSDELDAFLKGVDEASGWLEYEIVKCSNE